jgi:hypothetical protein
MGNSGYKKLIKKYQFSHFVDRYFAGIETIFNSNE